MECEFIVLLVEPTAIIEVAMGRTKGSVCRWLCHRKLLFSGAAASQGAQGGRVRQFLSRDLAWRFGPLVFRTPIDPLARGPLLEHPPEPFHDRDLRRTSVLPNRALRAPSMDLLGGYLPP